MSKTLIGIVSYGGLSFLKLALNAIRETVLRPHTVCVIVAKPDDQEMVHVLRESYPEVSMFIHHQNQGFPSSINDLYDHAFVHDNYDHLIICGNDVVPLPGAIDSMIETAETTSWEMVCGSEFDSRFLVNNYPEARQYFHGPNNDFTDFSARPWELHKDFHIGVEPDTRKDIRNLTLFKRSVFEKVGYADAGFYPNGYWEDLDYCVRCNRLGISACGLKQAAFFHFWSRTIHQGESRPNGTYFERNEWLYREKWGGGWGEEHYALPYHGDPYELCPGVHLSGSLRIGDRDQEDAILNYWRNK